MRPGAGPHQQNGMTGLGFSHGQMLTGSSFALNRGTKSGGVLSVWSRSAAVAVPRPRGAAGAQRRRRHEHGGRRLREGAHGERRSRRAQQRDRGVLRRAPRSGELGNHRGLPVDRLRGERADKRLDRRRLRRRRAAAQPRGRTTHRDRTVDGDGRRRRPRANRRKRARLLARVQGRRAVGRNAKRAGAYGRRPAQRNDRDR